MIRSITRDEKNQIRTDLPLNDIPAFLRRKRNFLWLDLVEEDTKHCESLLLDLFHFHPLAIDDALAEAHHPKIDDWDDYLYIVLHAVVFDPAQEDMLDTREVDFFIGKNYIVTYQAKALNAVERVWNACQRDARPLLRGLDYLLYLLADELVGEYLPVVEQLDEIIDQAENQIFENPKQELLEDILSYKRALLRLRRIIAPQREVLNKLARDEYEQLDPDKRIFFRDVYDHLVRLFDIIENLRDLVGSTLDTYLSVVNNRMNEIMKTLTTITVFFMPITFLTGFFGMNFFQPVFDLSNWTGQASFALVLILIVLSPLLIYLSMRRRRWM
ncbi:MAG: magnesium/cobalt transporter CorA [Anaerolineaceae bacterium]|nr:magnesium/cobalt transporter CorA [Anaerolineaceae bacterium]